MVQFTVHFIVSVKHLDIDIVFLITNAVTVP